MSSGWATGGQGRGDPALRHCTNADIEANYVDTHGASVVGFAFTELLGFRLLPRLKNIGAIRLYRPDDAGRAWPRLEPVLTRPIRWELIAQQYDQMIKYATALRLGTAEAEQVLRRFTRGGPKHPTYAAAGGTRPGRAHDLRLRLPRPSRAIDVSAFQRSAWSRQASLARG